MSNNRFVLDEANVSIHDTERDLYYTVVSVKTARLYTHKFNQPDHSGYADIVDDVDEWITAERLAEEPHESNDKIWDMAVFAGLLTEEEVAIGEGRTTPFAS